MRIISWNVNGLRANIKKGGFDWLMNESADIFCVQETKSRPDQLEAGVTAPAGYHAYFDHSKGRQGYSGVAVWTKVKPEKVDYGLGNHELDQEGRFLALYFPADAFKDSVDADAAAKNKSEHTVSHKKLGKFVFINIYFPNGGGGPERLAYKLRFYDEFLKYVKAAKKRGYEVIFCGDVNTAHTEIDLARPKENEKNTGFLPVERAWIDQVIDEGFIDVFRYLNPNAREKYTYWDMKTFARERNVGWRIDYFFATPGATRLVTKARILDQITGSDHCPIDIVIG
ncbi:MAG TPA: exodeoxyribonuclease III [Candidatus Paceibacterota bacterium]|jgi:exodeoxyribonuclease-3|nr:exodeoxyribonuclease III [Candidatus Paceibacterota bacterium]